MGILASLQVYADGYNVIDTLTFTEEELAAVKSAEVKQSEYGLSVCLTLVTGGKSYIPVGRDTLPHTKVGDIVDLRSAKVNVLKREDDIIQRIEF